MKAKRVHRSGDSVNVTPDMQGQADRLLLEIGILYRERFRAHYNNDQAAFQKLTTQIDQLRSKLSRIEVSPPQA